MSYETSATQFAGTTSSLANLNLGRILIRMSQGAVGTLEGDPQS
jgi:hypothetical protein